MSIKNSDSDSDDDGGDGEAELLNSDEDEIDDNGAQYLESLERRVHTHSNGTIQVINVAAFLCRQAARNNMYRKK